MMSTNKISIIIVTYNSKKYLPTLLSSLKFIVNLIGEVIIINNSPSEDLRNITTNNYIKLINNKTNIGFSAAVNKGIKISKYDHILLLNPDSYLIDKSIENMFDYYKNNKNIGAIGGKILSYDKKSIQFTATSKPNLLIGLFEFTILKRIFSNNIFSKKFWIENNKIKCPTNVYSLCGAFILFRKYLNSKLNMLDSKYFLYFEDIQFGGDINKNKYYVVYYPNTQISHYGGGSTKNKYKTNLKEWYKSRKIYFENNMNQVSSIILIVIFKLEETIVTLITKFKNEFAKY